MFLWFFCLSWFIDFREVRNESVITLGQDRILRPIFCQEGTCVTHTSSTETSQISNSCTKHDSSSFSETAVDKQSGRQLDMCRIYMPLRHCIASENTGEQEGVFYLSLWYVYKALWAFIQKLKRIIMLGDGMSMVSYSFSLELIIHLFVTEERKETEL